MISGAIISDDKKYRYQLWRIWDDSKPKILWIMLNPSTADESIDDPTIRNSGPYNHKHIDNMISKCEIIVCAWGNTHLNTFILFQRMGISFKEKNLYCLGINKNKTPKHPLYLRSNSKLQRYKFR